jgi:hypothetical protein
MSSPVYEKDQYSFPVFESDPPMNRPQHDRRSSDEDGTLQGEGLDDLTYHNNLRVYPSYAQGQDYIEKDSRAPMSPAAQREQSRRLDDDLEMLRAERVVSSAERSNQESSMGRSRSMMARSRSRNNPEPSDDFDVDTTPIHEKTKIYQPPANPTTKLAKFFKKVHQSSFLVRWFVYITPLTLLLLIPLLFGIWLFPQSTVGGVELLWFGIWLEIVWLTLWAGRVSYHHPYPNII